MLISLFITCYNDTLFPNTGKAVVRCWSASATKWSFAPPRPAAGRCTTTPGISAKLSRSCCSFEVFRGAEVICIPSASCVAMIRDHYPKMAAETGDPEVIAEVTGLLPRIFEFSELLDR